MHTSRLQNFLLVTAIILLVSACGKKEGLCELPGADKALKATLKSEMVKWQDNAEYAGIADFEVRVNQVIDGLTVVENNYYRPMNDDSACHCRVKIQFSDHQDYLDIIEGPVAKATTEEHPTNSAYIRMEEQISYQENDGFEFFYIMTMAPDSTLFAVAQYPLVMEFKMDDAGKVLYDYLEYQLKE